MTDRILVNTLVLASLGMSVAGCLPSHPGLTAASKRNCMADNAKFVDAWACIKAQVATRDTGAVDPKRDGFIEEGDILADQVRAGKVSESAARARLTAGMSREGL